MKRRKFVQTIPLAALVPAGLTALAGCDVDTGTTEAIKATKQSSSGVSGTGVVPDWVKSMKDSDMVYI